MSNITPSISPKSTEPGFMFSLPVGGTQYGVRAYYQDINGKKTYLPAAIDAHVRSQLQELALNLCSAHDYLRNSKKQAPYVIQTLESAGLRTTDHRLVDHDFNIATVDPSFADQTAASLVQAGHPPIEASAVKAIDIWNTMEALLRHNTFSFSPNHSRPSSPAPSAPAPVTTPKPTTTAPTPPTAPSSPSPTTTAPTSSANAPQPLPQPTPSREVSSVELDLQGIDYDAPDFYPKIPDNRTKLRIVSDIDDIRPWGGAVYSRVWSHFAAQKEKEFMKKEHRRLQRTCAALPSHIPADVRKEAAEIIDAYHALLPREQLTQKIAHLFKKEFKGKEQLCQRLSEHSLAEGIAIDAENLDWTGELTRDDQRRIAQAITGWLDNY